MRYDDNRTPLHYACVLGHKDVVQYLVEMANCDISEYNTAPNSIPGIHLISNSLMLLAQLNQIPCNYCGLTVCNVQM